MNLWQKMQAISNDIKNVEKNIRVGEGNMSYKAVGEVDVLAAVKSAEQKHGVISIPCKQEMIKQEIIETTNRFGKDVIYYVDTIKMTTKFVNLDEPTEVEYIESFGKGVDSGDKGVGKASTYARKYGLMNAYKIITGEDPDHNRSEEVSAKKPSPRSSAGLITMEQIKALVAFNLDGDVAKGILNSYGYQSSREVKEVDYQTIFSAFEKTAGMIK